MSAGPTYLRVVATTRCNYSCEYCHLEGDPHQFGTAFELATDVLVSCLRAAARVGVRKFKFVGGEPFLRSDLAQVIGTVRAAAPDADISIITAAVVPVRRLEEAFAAGLSRVNISIHGFTARALAQRNRAPRAYALRQAFIEAALARPGARVKFNYVYRGTEDLEDLGALLEWAAARRQLVNVLDDLGQDMSANDVAKAVRHLRGEPDRVIEVDDVHSLPTLHWHFADGLRIEIKNQRLGDVAPYRHCERCPVRSNCREGILALRLTHRGYLQPCVDRPDLGLPLAEFARTSGDAVAAIVWRNYVEAL
jgi:cyclic pyranopterin phosphate synthase